ncbi:ECF-type sigma factor [Tundrisphaera lichenicola]|uniref:ECF-type sigma factor n=1 Tax=Tundrisphaera lichenicola TaxID=2029860 RepID=UPI003EBA589C
MSDVTHLLGAAADGDRKAATELLPLVYDELRKLASARMAAEAPGHTLNATALVHEAYLRLVGPADDRRWDSRGHFFAAAAEAMRRILVDSARHKAAAKRGGGRQRAHADLDTLRVDDPDADLVALHEALERFAAHDPAKARLVELKFFAGLTLEQAAACLGISPSTADRGWKYARAWLYSAMAGGVSEEKVPTA